MKMDLWSYETGGVKYFHEIIFQKYLVHLVQLFNFRIKMHLRCFGIMRGNRNFAFDLVVKLSVEMDYLFLSLRL
jgi:hypothetical protein